MKKFLFCAGLVMAAALCSCSGKKDSSALWGSGEDETVEITIEDESYTVSRYTAENYDLKLQIHGALLREKNLEGIVRPTDVSTFGRKTAEFEWKAFKNPVKDKNNPSALDMTPVSVGTVKVIHYKHGLEVVKDGQSWFYDADHLYRPSGGASIFALMEMEELESPVISAVESILHPGVWEPAKIHLTKGCEDVIDFIPRYGASREPLVPEFLTLNNDLQIKEAKDLLVSQKLY